MKYLSKFRLVLAAMAVACLGLFVSAPTHAQTAPTITLMHGIPGVNVDVLVDGAVVFADFKPEEMKDLSSFAGKTLKNLEVRATGSTTPVIGPVDYPVPASGNYTVLAHLTADGKPTIDKYLNTTTKTPAGEGRLVVIHAAAAPAVDVVLADGTRPIVDLKNDGTGKALELKFGSITGAKLAPTGAAPIADIPAINLVAGVNLNVFAVGSLDGKTLTFYRQPITVGEAPAVTTTTTSTTTPTTTIAPTTTRPVGPTTTVRLPDTGQREDTAVLALAFLALGAALVATSRLGASRKA